MIYAREVCVQSVAPNWHRMRSVYLAASAGRMWMMCAVPVQLCQRNAGRPRGVLSEITHTPR